MLRLPGLRPVIFAYKPPPENTVIGLPHLEAVICPEVENCRNYRRLVDSQTPLTPSRRRRQSHCIRGRVRDWNIFPSPPPRAWGLD